jgi:hypothetical protein
VASALAAIHGKGIVHRDLKPANVLLLAVEGAVDFVKGISDAELVDLVRGAQIACVPSLYEGFSLPAVEHMASGTPLVASRTGALPEVTGDAAVLDAPWAWDGSLQPLRWSVDVRVTWGGLELRERRDSRVLNPALGAWSVRIGDAEKAYASDPLDADFGSLAERYVLPLWDAVSDGEPLTVHATSTIAVPDDREVAFAYWAGGPVSVAVDGAPLQADVTGAGPVRNGTLHPWPRRTAPVRLTAGEHAVRFTCEKPADLPRFHLYLSACVVEPGGDRVLLDVSAS